MELIKLADGSELKSLADIQALYDKSAAAGASVVTLTAERDGLKTENDGFKQAAKDATLAEATTLVDAAVADGRIDATPDKDGKSGKTGWMSFFESDRGSAKIALAAIPKRKNVAVDLGDDGNETEREAFVKLSWEELDRSDKLETVKAKYYDLYESKFEKEFGRKPKTKS